MSQERQETTEGSQRGEIRESIRMLLDLDAGTPGVLAKGLKEFRPVEIAEVLQDFNEEAAARIIAALPSEEAAEVLVETDPLTRSNIIDSAQDRQLRELVAAMPPDEGADLLELMDDRERREVLDHIEPAAAKELRSLERYDPESAGGIMTPRVISVRVESTSDEALAAVRSDPDLEVFHYVYVTDGENRLRGVVTARKLVAAARATPVSNIMETDVVSVRTDEDQETVAGIVRKYNFSAVPVVDTRGRLAGVITVDDIIDVIDEEFSEDIFRLAGTAATHPTREPVVRRVLLRLPWLMVTLTGGLVVSLVVWKFERSLEAVVAIFAFLPVVNGMGGNVGIQSSTIMVRGLATGEVDFSRLNKVLFGEIRVGALLAVFFGLVITVTVYFLSHLLWGDGAAVEGPPTDPLRLGMSVGLAMMAGIVVSALVGTMVPMLCWRIGIDPAITAGPFVTVLNDVFCTAIYLTVATLIILGGTG